jgi:hypothetical protein
MCTGSFPGIESGRGMTLIPHPLLVPRYKNSRAIPLLSLRAFVACKKDETYKTEVSCQLHAPAALRSGKPAQYPLKREAKWVPRTGLNFFMIKISFPCWGSNPRSYSA